MRCSFTWQDTHRDLLLPSMMEGGSRKNQIQILFFQAGNQIRAISAEHDSHYTTAPTINMVILSKIKNELQSILFKYEKAGMKLHDIMPIEN